jgi:probable HAF family extracellular repeat protein
MKTSALLLLAAALPMYAAPDVPLRFRQTYVYTRFDVPNAAATTAFGINDEGGIVGVYTDTGGRQHGFRLSNDAFTTIDYPGAVLTSARGIAATGDVVGAYRLPGEPSVNLHGYLLTKTGEFRGANYPGHTNTIAQRVLANGAILGCYHDNDMMTTMHGVLLAAAGHSEVDMMATMNNGATPDLSIIVGLYTDMDMGKGRAYVIIDGKFLPFDYPNAKSTAAWDISPAGAIVGVIQDEADRIRGFALGDNGFEPIAFPDAAETRAFGINARGDIVGSFLDKDKKTHAFIARRVMVDVPPAEMKRAEP